MAHDRDRRVRERNRAVLAGFIGAMLEWYDFSLFSLASALVFSRVFFTESDATSGILSSFAVFGVGFVARPIGGMILGRFGDKIGRRKILVFTLVLMSLASTAIGLIPTFDQIGYWAPAILVLTRIAQGLGAGAEYVGSALLASEHAPDKRRGLFTALPTMGNPTGILAATAFMGAMAALPEHEFLVWGWRVPFLVSIILLGFGLYVRIRVGESPVFQADSKKTALSKKLGFRALFRYHPKAVIFTLMISSAPNVAVYLPTAFALSYIREDLGMLPTVATGAQTISTITGIIMMPIAGWLADRFGRRVVFGTATLISAGMAFPFFWLLDTEMVVLIWLAFVAMYSFSAEVMIGVQGSLLAEQFPTEVRFSGMVLAREVSAAAVGGTLPFIATAIVGATGATWGVSLYVIVFSLVGFVGTMLAKEGHGISLVGMASGRTDRESFAEPTTTAPTDPA